MKEPSKLNTELTDHLLSKVISYATRENRPVGDIVQLDERLKEGISLMKEMHVTILIAKIVTKTVLRSMLNYGPDTGKETNELCRNILLFNETDLIDPFVVAKLLTEFTNGKIATKEDAHVEVTKIEKIVNYKTEPSETEYVSNDFDFRQTDYQSQRYGSLRKKKLNLSSKEVKLLNLIWVTGNVFTNIEQCAAESARLYLHLVNEVESYYKVKGEDFLALLESLDKRERGNDSYDFYYPEYNSPVTSRILNGLFKLSENSIREHYRHTRKRDTSTVYQTLEIDLEFKAQDYIEDAIAAYRLKVSEPNPSTLLQLNELNRARWKVGFSEIKSKKTTLTPKELLQSTEKLITENERNPSKANIYFEAMKLFSSINSITALKFYVYYYASKLTAKKPRIKSLPKTVSKKVFANQNQEEKFNKILVLLMGDRQTAKAINQVPKIFEVERKKVKINRNEISRINETHQETVEKLNVILKEEEVDPIEEKATVVKKAIEPKEESLESIFGDSDDEEEDGDLTFSTIQKSFLENFKKHKYTLTEEQINIFAKENKIFKGQLINGINEVFYEIEEDVLIEEEDGIYSIDEEFINFLD